MHGPQAGSEAAASTLVEMEGGKCARLHGP